MNLELNPDFPVVTGHYQLTDGWRVQLPQPFNRRIEDGSLVLWMPELTLWINLWHNESKASVDELIARATDSLNPQRSDEQLEKTAGMVRLTYELTEQADDPETPATLATHSINAYIAAPAGMVQMSAYVDSPDARALAYDIIRSVSTGA